VTGTPHQASQPTDACRGGLPFNGQGPMQAPRPPHARPRPNATPGEIDGTEGSTVMSKFTALLISCAALMACSTSGSPPAIPGAEGLWTGTLQARSPTNHCPGIPGEPHPADWTLHLDVNLSGSTVVMRDQAGRRYSGEVTSPDSLTADCTDPHSNGIDIYSIRVQFSHIIDGAADVELAYCYSRPAYGCCAQYQGVLHLDTPGKAL